MPIQGLTNQPGRFVECGRLRKGDPKPESGIGKDLTYFRFDAADQAGHDAFYTYYPTPEAQRRIEIFLPYPATAENFTAFREHRKFSELLHRCDGDHVWKRDQTGQFYETTTPCPTKELDDRDKKGGKNAAKCHPIGRLSMIIPALNRYAYVLLTTTSTIDISALSRELAAIEQAAGRCDGIPCILSRVKESTPSRGRDGQKTKADRYMLHIEIDPALAQLQLAGMRESALLSASQPRALAAPAARLALPAPATIQHPTRVINGRTVLEFSGEILDDTELWQDDDDNDLIDDEPSATYAEHGSDNAPKAEPAPPAPKAAADYTPAERQKMISKIRRQMNSLADMGLPLPGTEIAADFAAMSNADLIALGTSYKAQLNQALAEKA